MYVLNKLHNLQTSGGYGREHVIKTHMRINKIF